MMKGKPESGYRNVNKRLYRREVYEHVDQLLRNHLPKPSRKVAYLESSDAEETRILLNRGYSPDNLYPFNRNVAEAAVVSRKIREKFGWKVNSQGKDIARLAEVCPVVDIIHLDFCGPLNDTSGRVITYLKDTCFQEGTIVIVNVLRGRENTPIAKATLKEFRENDILRKRTEKMLFGDCPQGGDIARTKAMVNVLSGWSVDFNTGEIGRMGKKCFVFVDIKAGQYKSTSGLTFTWLVGAAVRPWTIERLGLAPRVIGSFDFPCPLNDKRFYDVKPPPEHLMAMYPKGLTHVSL